MIALTNPLALKIPFLRPQATQRLSVLNSVAFSGIPTLVTEEEQARWIDKDVYNLLFRLPKAELHLHQGGSADLGYLKYRLFRSIKSGDPRVQKIAIRSDNHQGYTTINFEGKSDHFILGTISFILLRDLLRFKGDENQKVAYLDADLIQKINENPDSRETLLAEYQAQNQSLLDEYRRISDIINPYVKNTPSAYYLASLYANEAMEERTRYAEYRISPKGRFDLTKHKNSFDGSSVEDVIHAVQQGFEDANMRVVKSGRRLDYGIIMLMERNAKSVEDLMAESLLMDEHTSSYDPFLRIVKRAIRSVIERPTFDQLRSMNVKDRKNALKDIKKKLNLDTVSQMEAHNWNQAIANAKEVALEAVRLKQIGYHVVGIDLAGGESVSDVTRFADAFKIIHDYNNTQSDPDKRLGITIHAGEVPHSENISGVQSMKQAIKLGWSPNTRLRIGQGLQVVQDPEAQQILKFYEQYKTDKDAINKISLNDRIAAINASPLLKEIAIKKIHLEYCPKSNIQTQGVKSHNDHPALFIHRLGKGLMLNEQGQIVKNERFPERSMFSISISTDNRTISNSDITNEYVKLLKHHGMTYQEVKDITYNTFDAAFCDAKTKEKLREKLDEEFWDFEHSNKYYTGLHKLREGLWQKDSPGPNAADQITALARTTAETFIRECYRLGVNYKNAQRELLTAFIENRKKKLDEIDFPELEPEHRFLTMAQVDKQRSSTKPE